MSIFERPFTQVLLYLISEHLPIDAFDASSFSQSKNDSFLFMKALICCASYC